MKFLPPDVFSIDYDTGGFPDAQPSLGLAPRSGWYSYVPYVDGLESIATVVNFEYSYYYTGFVITAKPANLLAPDVSDFDVPVGSTFHFRVENELEVEIDSAQVSITGFDASGMDIGDLFALPAIALNATTYELQTLVGLKPIVELTPSGIDVSNLSSSTTLKLNLDQLATYTFTASHGNSTSTVSLTTKGYEFGFDNVQLRTMREDSLEFQSEQVDPVHLELPDNLEVAVLDVDAFEVKPTRPYDMSLLARLGDYGPVLDRLDIEAFEISSANESYLPILDVFEDGRVKVRGALMVKNLPDDVTIRIEIFRAGVTFEDGTVTKVISSADFDSSGRFYYPMIKPAGLNGSTCHRAKIYINGSLYGDVYFE